MTAVPAAATRRGVAAGRRGWAALVAVVAVGLVVVWTGSASAADGVGDTPTPAPVSNSFAMGGGLSGTIDERTGAFEASFPLVALRGRGQVGGSFSLGYDQSLAAQGTDRFGLGAGWTLGMPWVDTAGGVQVYPATGGSYAYDKSSPTGLGQYPLRDLKFAKDAGVAPARPGVEAQPYSYTLTYLDASEDRFSAAGNLVERVDRFGNRIDITWRQSGPAWQPTSMVDSYGQVTSFGYQSGGVTVTSPPRPDGVSATVALEIDQGRLATIQDPVGQKTQLSYTPVPGLPAPLLDTVVSPTGERTAVSYEHVAYEHQLTVVVVDKARVTDAGGADVLAEREFTFDPPGNPDQHNYTGYPNHVKAGSDGLFDSGDSGYRYVTELSDGTSTVQSTYNSVHLVTMRRVLVRQGLATVRAQQQEFGYPGVPNPADPPANYAKPISTKITYGDPIFGSTRSVQTSSSYDDHGQLESSTNADGTVTKTEFDYDHYGLPKTQTVTGTDGTTSITTNDLTADGKAIATTTTAVGASGQTPTARTVTTYGYDDFGELTDQSRAWAGGAQPPGPSGGPDQLDQNRTVTVDADAHTRTDVVTAAAGTTAAASTKTVSDLVTGQVLSRTDPAGRPTSYQYDAADRVTAVTAPGDRTTKTDYTSPTTTTTTGPDGHIQRTTTDVLGRTVKVTDNVSDQKLVADPGARTLSTSDYSVDGQTITTTGPTGALTTTTLDPLGRPVKTVKANGVTQTTAYDDVKNTQTKTTIPAGGQASDLSAVTVAGFDDLNRATSSATTYPDRSAQAPTSQSYDGLGRVTSLTSADLKATASYAGAGGLQTKTALTPTDQEFPGAPLAAATDNTMTGASTLKTISDDSASTPGAAYTYDPAGRVDTVTGPGDAKSGYTYTPDGKIATVTSPSGVHTSHHYDPTTGQLDETDVSPAGAGATQKTAYDYDPNTGRPTAVFDPDDPSDKIGYGYDADGHTTAVHYPDGTTTAASYKDTGQLDTSTDITGAATTYSYNPAGDLTGATQTRGGATLASVGYSYDALDRVQTITRGNGVKTALTYTDANQAKTETTTAANGTTLQTSAYSYDAHGNLHSRTDQTLTPPGARRRHGPKPRPAAKPPTRADTPRRGATSRRGQTSRPGQTPRREETTAAARKRPRAGKAAAAPSRRRATATGPSTTIYGYDAYNRLTDSKTYPNQSGTGTPTTETTYTVNASGDVTGQKTTGGATTSSTTNTFGPGNRLTARTVDGKQTNQSFDADGNVTRDLAGNAYSYDPTDHPTSLTTPDGATTAYRYWPDRTLRSATTTDKAGAHTTSFHNNTAGVLINDTHAAGQGQAGGVTASYLYGLNREGRALVSDTGPGRSGRGAVRTSGPGAGYYVHDRHGSVAAITDGTGQLTDSYRYSDYGQPTQTSPAAGGAGAAADASVNPFTYCGAYTNPETGTQDLPARSYDPSQGRFLTADSAALLNRYQAFNTNPINFCDPTGQWSVSDTYALLGAIGAVIAAVATGGAAITADAAIFAAVGAGEEVAASTAASAALLTASAAANVGAAATTTTLFADDAASLSGHHFLTNDQRTKLTSATLGLGAIGAAAGAGGAGLAPASAADIAEDVTASAEEQTALPPSVEGIQMQPKDLSNVEQLFGTTTPSSVEGIQMQPKDLSNVEQLFGTTTPSSVEGIQMQPKDLSNVEQLFGTTTPSSVEGIQMQPKDPFAFEPLSGTTTPWDAVAAVKPPAADTPWGPGPPLGATQANPSALGASNPLVKQASTTVTDTLQSNSQLVSPKPPQSPLPQNTSPASFSPF